MIGERSPGTWVKFMKQPKLSIIILNHNTKTLLKRCLGSISYDCQIIVVDNNSSDGSVAMVEKEFSKVEVIKRTVNDGYTRGNNAARKFAKGEYVLFLNSDTKAFPDTISTMVKFMDTDPKIGVSTCLTELPNGKLYYACHRGFPSPWNSLCYFTGLSKLFPKVKFLNGYTMNYERLSTTHPIDACSGTFLLTRRRLLEKIGWFDEDYFSYGEDLEMCYRVKELGYKVMFNPDVKIIHYWGATSGLKSTSKKIAFQDEENKNRWNLARYEAMKIFYDKHYREQYSELFRWVVFRGIDVMNKLRKGKD